jgi:putative membrane protein
MFSSVRALQSCTNARLHKTNTLIVGVDTVLLTVLGFVVGLGLSFRSSTAYERYNEGRKYWSQLMLASQNMARVVWLHGIERPGEQGKDDLLAKMCVHFNVSYQDI